MSFYLMKSTKDDESDFSEQDQFPIGSAPSGLWRTERQNSESRAPPVPGGASALINESVSSPFYSKERVN